MSNELSYSSKRLLYLWIDYLSSAAHYDYWRLLKAWSIVLFLPHPLFPLNYFIQLDSSVFFLGVFFFPVILLYKIQKQTGNKFFLSEQVIL